MNLSSASAASSFAELNLSDGGDQYDFKFAEKKHGSDGRKCIVKANFAPIEIKAKVLYQYNIEIKVRDRVEEEGDKNRPQHNRLKQQKKMINDSNFEIFKKFRLEHADVFKKPDGSLITEPIFDGKKIFYTKSNIKLEKPARGEYEVRVKVPEKKFPQTFIVIITKPTNNAIDLSILNNKTLRSAERELQALDLILTYGAKHHNLVLNSKMFRRFNDLIGLNEKERGNIRFELGDMLAGSFGHHQVRSLSFNFKFSYL